MIRTLIGTVLVTAAAIRFGVPADIALGYSFVMCLTVWFLWPMLRHLARLTRRARRQLSRHLAPAPARAMSTPALTQINHYHYYGPTASPPTSTQPDPTLRALPRRGKQQILHDAIYRADGRS